MNYLQKKKLAFMSIVNSVKGFIRTITGVFPLTLTNCVDEESIADYTIYGNSVQNGGILPIEYQQIEYIEATGTQYFRLDYIASNKTIADCKYQITNTDVPRMLFGSRKDSASQNYTFNWGGSSKPYKIYNAYNNNTIASLTDTIIDNEIHIINKKEGELYYDGELIHTSASSTFTTPAKMIVFGCATNSTIGLFAEARIYYLQFSEGDEIKVNLIPCYRKTDEVIGMYDLVTGTFYTNHGDGTFLKGASYPTPDNPIEVECVGEKTVNLIPEWKAGWIPPNTGVLDTTYYPNRRYTDYIPIKTNTSYYVSGGGTSSNWTLYDENYNYLQGQILGSSRNIKHSSAKYVRLAHPSSNVDGIQLEEGTTATAYEPYGYKIPITVSGKNLFDINTVTSATDDWYYKSGSYSYNLGLEAGKQYTISCEMMTITSGLSISICRKPDISKWDYTTIYSFGTILGKHSYTFIADGTECLWFYKDGGLSLTTVQNCLRNNIKDIQLKEGSTATDYEPITTNIYLDEPLRKVGDYADYINFEDGKVVRSVGCYTFNGDEEWVQHITTTDGGYGVFRTEGFVEPLIGAPMTSTFMTHFAITNVVSTASWDVGLYRNQGSSGNISSGRIYISAYQTTVEDFKEWLSENKPLYIYPLATPTETPITLPNIPTFRGTSILNADTTTQPSNAEITYYSTLKG